VLQDCTMDMFKPILLQYKTEFERLFYMTKNGSLKADWPRLQEIQNFIERCGMLIDFQTGFVFNHFEFVQAYRGDIGTINENKVKLLQVYAVCFCCYSKACQALHVQPAASYNLFVRLDQIDLNPEEDEKVKVEDNKS